MTGSDGGIRIGSQPFSNPKQLYPARSWDVDWAWERTHNQCGRNVGNPAGVGKNPKRDWRVGSRATLTPPVLLVFLGLTVGDMSIGGVGTATFRHEAQVDNVLEPVLITGTGELVTCSETTQPACLHPRWPGKASRSTSGCACPGSPGSRRPAGPPTTRTHTPERRSAADLRRPQS